MNSNQKAPIALTPEELLSVLKEALENNDRQSYVMFLIIVSHGLRVSEALSLRRRDFDETANGKVQLTVGRLKGSNETTQDLCSTPDFPLLDELAVVRTYIKDLKPNQFLFDLGDRFAVGRRFGRYARLAGVAKMKRHVHVLKHTTDHKGKDKLVAELARQRAEYEEDENWGFQMLNYEDDRWREQTEALAAMALALLASLTKVFLDEQKGGSLNKTHPPHRKAYEGKSELMRRVTEYKARFGVDLEALDYFETVREIELARNCALHNEGFFSEHYCKLTKMRLSIDSERINLSPEQLDCFIKEFSSFGDSLGKALKEVRAAKKTDSA
jgi:Phage integrase family